MRSAIVAAFAAGAVGVPFNVARDIVTDVAIDVVYATDIITVTAGQQPATSPVEDVQQPTSTQSYSHYGHAGWAGWSSQAAPAPPSSTTSSSVHIAPTTSAAASTSQAPASSAAQSAWSSPSAATGATASSYSDLVVGHHNIHRQNHSAPALSWDSGLASTAQKIAASCVYAHNTDANGGGYGQNIAAGVKGDNVSAIITDLFYNSEVGWYDGLYGQTQPDMVNFDKWGHFSQIVWSSTTKVGCYTQDCSGQGLANVGSDVAPFFTVCNYSPPGNFANEYNSVGSPLGHATANHNTPVSA